MYIYIHIYINTYSYRTHIRIQDQNVYPWDSGFNGYREHLLRKLEDQLAAIMPGCGERPGEKEAAKNK
jgi:hypothetical protein